VYDNSIDELNNILIEYEKRSEKYELQIESYQKEIEVLKEKNE
jgi:hypothetical protein